MEYKVLSDNIVLEVALTVKKSVLKLNSVVKSDVIQFNDCLTFQTKHIRTYIEDREFDSDYNMILLRINKLDLKDLCTYRVKLSCPEFAIQESTFYSDQSHWHVLNNNNYNSEYTFTIKIESEVLTYNKFSELYEDEQLTDFKLKGHDGEVNIHKAFLAATSSSFRSKIADSNESGSSLELPKTSVNTLQDFKKCIYREVYPDENLEELLLLASYFKIKWLEFKCVDIIMKKMTFSDTIHLLEFAVEHKHMPLFLGILGSVQNGKIKISEIRKNYLQH